MAIDRAIAIRNGVIVVVLLLLGGWLVYQWKPEWFAVSSADESASHSEPAPNSEPALLQEPPLEPTPDFEDRALAHWVEITGSGPAPGSLGVISDDCESIDRAWRRACAHMDARFPLDDSYELSIELLDALSQTQPRVSGELLQHGAMLQNVFHLFRVVGEERMVSLSQVLQQEDLLEPASHAFYRWVSASGRCTGSGARSISPAVLNEYAAYLFQTLGGQAYLRRRAPRAEALACFYAIQAIDRAQQSGKNSQGYDPRREIPRCRRLLAAEQWMLGQEYVETLDRIATDWESR